MVGTDILELTLGSVGERTWGLGIASRVIEVDIISGCLELWMNW